MSEGHPPLTTTDVVQALTGAPRGKPARFRVSRPCYDKYHRCPGRNGGGLRYAKVIRCKKGLLPYLTDRKLGRWRVNRCPECRVWVLPYVIRYADPSWLGYRAWRLAGDLSYRAQRWQEEAQLAEDDDPVFWQQRWPLPVRAALFPLGFALGTLQWAALNLADQLLPGFSDAGDYWYQRSLRRERRREREEEEGERLTDHVLKIRREEEGSEPAPGS